MEVPGPCWRTCLLTHNIINWAQLIWPIDLRKITSQQSLGNVSISWSLDSDWWWVTEFLCGANYHKDWKIIDHYIIIKWGTTKTESRNQTLSFPSRYPNPTFLYSSFRMASRDFIDDPFNRGHVFTPHEWDRSPRIQSLLLAHSN